MHRLLRLGLAAALALGCYVPDSPHAAVIARYRGPIDAERAELARWMTYMPVDQPLAWLRSGAIVVLHQELYAPHYSALELGTRICQGSGFLAVASGGVLRRPTARPIAIGGAACEGGLRNPSVAVEPAGAWAVYSTRMNYDSSSLVRLDLATGREDSLPLGCDATEDAAAVSRDGGWIAFRRTCRDRDAESGIYVVRPDGSGLRRVAPDEPGGGIGSPSWSPDGRQIAFVRRRTFEAPGEIIVVDAANGRERLLTHGVEPSWSPDGRWIAYVVEDSTRWESRTIRLVHPDGSGARDLFRNRRWKTYSSEWGWARDGLPVGQLVWSPDSRSLAFSRLSSRGMSVWRVDLRSGAAAQVTAPARR